MRRRRGRGTGRNRSARSPVNCTGAVTPRWPSRNPLSASCVIPESHRVSRFTLERRRQAVYVANSDGIDDSELPTKPLPVDEQAVAEPGAVAEPVAVVE